MQIQRFRTPALIAAAVVATAAITIPVSATAAVRYVALGAKNSTTATTTVTNSGGTALALNSKSGTAPLAVNSTKVVTRLNADLLDGLHATSFARSTGQTGTLLGVGEVDCPAGTVITGGGGLATAADGVTPSSLAYSGPALNATGDGFVRNSWEALGAGAGDSVYTLAVCYNPKGAVPGALTPVAAKQLAAKSPVLQKLLARR